jgi:hypothetical protein
MAREAVPEASADDRLEALLRISRFGGQGFWNSGNARVLYDFIGDGRGG